MNGENLYENWKKKKTRVLNRIPLQRGIQWRYAYGHFILSEGPRFVAANNSGASQGLDSLEMFHHTIFARHFVRRQREANGHSGYQSLRHVGNNDAEQERDWIDPSVSHSGGQSEEQHPEEYCPARY